MAAQLKDEASIEQILAEMTLEEKAEMIQGSAPFHSAAMPKYGIPAIYMIDTCTGMNMREYLSEALYLKMDADAKAAGVPLDREKNGYMGGLLLALGALQKKMAEQAASGAPKAKQEYGCYPPAMAVACTWNPAIANECGRTVARELGSKGIDMILGPCINIMRDPLHGRLCETYSEDPVLMGKMAAETVKGIQSTGVLADVKHFAANNQEKDRMGVEEHISERALREIYFPAFKACVDAGAKTIMSAYNKVNGVPAAMNRWLQTDVLRKEWGFDGFVVSDWGASYDVPSAVMAGTDLTMPGPQSIRMITKAVEEGRLTEEALDAAVRNILKITLQSTAFTGQRPLFELKEAYAVSEKTAQESTVLLKNDGVLPLSPGDAVAFYGKRCRDYVVIPASVAAPTDLAVNPAEEMEKRIGTDRVTYGCCTEETKIWMVAVGADACEGADRLDMEMDADDREALDAAIAEAKAHGGKVVVIINSSGPVEFASYEPRVNAVIAPFFGGMMSGKAVADILYGDVNPSGKLPLTWPMHYCDTPAYKNYGTENKEVWYGEGIYVGYRWYDARHIRPLYPFGFGLSYTTFEITEAEVPDNVIVDTDDVRVRVTVKNTGSRAGAEVVQLYVHDRTKTYDRPEKELKAFAKVSLEAGEEKTVELVLAKQDFAGFYAPFGQWMTQPGIFDLLIGTSAADISIKKEIRIRCRNPFGLSGRTAVGEIASRPEALAIVDAAMEDSLTTLAAVALAYAPDKSLEELWHGTNIQNALAGKGWEPEEIARRYAQILAGFDALEAAAV